MPEKLACTPKSLPPSKMIEAAQNAVKVNPANRPHPAVMTHAFGPGALTPAALTLMVAKRWPVTGVKLTVGFLEPTPADLRARILLHMNAWGKYANTKFVFAKTDPQVRIAFADDGYWSYVGTDILSIAKNEATLNLQAFTMKTAESEYHRVVRHETGHTLGFPHEHMRQALVDRIDPKKAIAYFGATQGWTPDEVRQQVLTPLEESAIIGSAADQTSIMCYQIPGSLTKDGKPIIGGTDIDPIDSQYAASFYPKAVKKKN